MEKISRTTSLRELRARAKALRFTDGIVSPNLVRSVQQSMRVEGHEVSEDDVRAAAVRVLGR